MTKSFDFTPVVVSSPQCLKHFTKKERREYLHMQYSILLFLLNVKSQNNFWQEIFE